MSKLTCTVLAVLLVGAAGCGSATVSSSGKPASAKWVGPAWPGPGGGTVKTVIYYGPWQCNAEYMNRCQRRCASEGHTLKGCIWLADVKGDWQGRFAFLPAEAGGRLALTHCCCDYPTVSDTQARRDIWKNARDGFRNEWAREFGAWPKSGSGDHWPGHHIFDLWHGGDPTAPGNVLPVPTEVHKVINDAYPACYAGGSQWSNVGFDRPYVD